MSLYLPRLGEIRKLVWKRPVLSPVYGLMAYVRRSQVLAQGGNVEEIPGARTQA